MWLVSERQGQVPSVQLNNCNPGLLQVRKTLCRIDAVMHDDADDQSRLRRMQTFFHRYARIRIPPRMTTSVGRGFLLRISLGSDAGGFSLVTWAVVVKDDEGHKGWWFNVRFWGRKSVDEMSDMIQEVFRSHLFHPRLNLNLGGDAHVLRQDTPGTHATARSTDKILRCYPA